MASYLLKRSIFETQTFIFTMYLFNKIFWAKGFRSYQKWLIITLGLFSSSAGMYGQAANVITHQDISRWMSVAPESVFKMFRESGMAPVNHELTEIEKAKIEKAFAGLPPLYHKVLKGHLHSISFMDNMPNTALTSPVESSDSTKIFNITFRAGILHETISQWATWKEYSCYDTLKTPGYKISIEGGNLDAFMYVLLHEASHVLDAVLEITPPVLDRAALVKPTHFTQGIWYKMNVPNEKYIDSLLEKTRFRSGKSVPIASAPEIYKVLRKTPFASLYGMASWSEDFAELATIYHLTQKMNQPFYISVKKNGLELMRFEPMKNKLVKRRLKKLEFLYNG